MNIVSLLSPSKRLAGLITYTLAILLMGILSHVFVSDGKPDASICVSVPAPDTESSVDKQD